MEISSADLVRWSQHGLAVFLVGFPILVLLRPRSSWIQGLQLRLIHAVLCVVVAGNACLGNLSHLSVLEWRLRDRAVGSESSWFDVPVSDPVAAAAKLFNNTSRVPLLVLPIGILVLATFWTARSSGRNE